MQTSREAGLQPNSEKGEPWVGTGLLHLTKQGRTGAGGERGCRRISSQIAEPSFKHT